MVPFFPFIHQVEQKDNDTYEQLYLEIEPICQPQEEKEEEERVVIIEVF